MVKYLIDPRPPNPAFEQEMAAMLADVEKARERLIRHRDKLIRDLAQKERELQAVQETLRLHQKGLTIREATTGD